MVTAAAPAGIGIFEGLSYEQYDAIKAYRRSVVSLGVEGKGTLAHVKDAVDHPDSSESEALLFGQALHAAVLEPDRFERDVVLGEINPKTGEPYGADTKAQQEFRRNNPGKIVMSKGDRARLLGMGASLRRHPNAMKLLRACRQTELTLVWEDAVTGVRCKARLDAGGAGDGLGMLDLKSTTSAAYGAFSRSIYDYGYHIQAAMSIDGWAALTGRDEPFTIIAAEKEPPYAVAIYTIDAESVSIGRTEYRDVLRGIAEAQRTGEWPAYPTEVMPIGVPEWVHKRFANSM